MFPICRGNVCNYVLHKLAHLPVSKEDVALKFSVILSFFMFKKYPVYIGSVCKLNIENIHHNESNIALRFFYLLLTLLMIIMHIIFSLEILR